MSHETRPYGRFFLPGPTEVHPDVLAAQDRPMISHRGPEIKVLMAELQAGLEVVFCTSRPVFISTSSATGLMEAAVRNAGRTRLLSLVNGAFSKRFADIAIPASAILLVLVAVISGLWLARMIGAGLGQALPPRGSTAMRPAPQQSV